MLVYDAVFIREPCRIVRNWGSLVQECKLCYWKVAHNVIIAKICSSSFNK